MLNKQPDEKEFRPAIPFTFGLIPKLGEIYKVSVSEREIVKYVGARPSVQKINGTTHISRDQFNNVAVGTHFSDGSHNETQYENVQKCDDFVSMIDRAKKLATNEI